MKLLVLRSWALQLVWGRKNWMCVFVETNPLGGDREKDVCIHLS